MAATSGSDFTVESHAGRYRVAFSTRPYGWRGAVEGDDAFFVVDSEVARLHADALSGILRSARVLMVDATEEAKSLEHLAPVVSVIAGSGFRRGGTLVAIGGGVVQDVTCFVAANLYRGVDWQFVPTTLLAQADSCIGSKSSINVLGTKNLMGTFTPPSAVFLDTIFLSTLGEDEIRSGIGEMLKVHAIDGPESFRRIALDLGRLLDDRQLLEKYISDSLRIKKQFVEQDEFDRGLRNVLNYGHSFGHAIEAATGYAIPHGIAITIGMDMANSVAVDLGVATPEVRDSMAPSLRANYEPFRHVPIPIGPVLDALAKDKKNTRTALRLVLPDHHAVIGIRDVPVSPEFSASCEQFLRGMTS